ncbi:Zinc finger, CCHC-type [Sesbania bispinosa]|nr:Zinc finger, CCHC-type [Sesbania bispinosa]
MESSVQWCGAEEGEELELETLNNGNNEGVLVARRTLVGRVIAEKTLNRLAVKEIVSKAWNVNDEIKISDLGPNVYLFTFTEADSARKILEEGPWFIMGHLLSLQYWIPEVSIFEVNYDHVLFWVQLHGLPLEFMSCINARKVAQRIGEVHTVEDPFVEGQLLRPFFRVRVRVNVKKPLLTGFWLPRKDLPRTWIFVKYERLQDFCYNCGVLGHDYRKCKKEKEMAVHVPNRPRYGPNLVVPQAKSMAAIILENTNRARRLHGEGEGDVAGERNHKGRRHAASEKGISSYDRTEAATKSSEQGSGAEVENAQPQYADNGADGIRTFPEGTKVGSAPEHERDSCISGSVGVYYREGPLPTTISPTLVDLRDGHVQPGLGPKNYIDLDLEKEDVGLKEKTIIWDVRSPTRDGSSLYGVSLNANEIKLCRETEDADDGGVEVPESAPEVDFQLAQGFMQKVNLKRQRSIPMIEGDLAGEGEIIPFIKKAKQRGDEEIVCTYSFPTVLTNDITLAEEAGLNKPPTQP